MKRLSDFEGVAAITTSAKIMKVLSRIVSNEANKTAKNDTVMGLFIRFAENTPDDMNEIFAILNEADPATYHCNGAEAFENLKTLANDPAIAGLFLSQRQTGVAKSSGSASENTEA